MKVSNQEGRKQEEEMTKEMKEKCEAEKNTIT